MSEVTVRQGGIGLGSLVFVALLVLKMMGEIEMGWFWVLTSIFWVPIAVLLAVMGLMAGIALVVTGVAFIGLWISEKFS